MDYPDFPPKHPLSDVIHQVYQAMVEAHRHLCARQGSLTEQDMHLFGRLRETMWMQYFTSRRTSSTRPASPSPSSPRSRRRWWIGKFSCFGIPRARRPSVQIFLDNKFLDR